MYMKERSGLPVTDEDRTLAEANAQKRQRKFTNREELWDKRKDWGRWFSEDATKKKRERAARAKKSLERVQGHVVDAEGSGKAKTAAGDGGKD